MDDEVERVATEIHKGNPVTLDGKQLDWPQVVKLHPDRAAMYREAAHNRIRAAEAMKRLANEPRRRPSA